MAWPILLMLSALSWTSSPSGPNASSSKKHQMPDAGIEELAVARAFLLVGGEDRPLGGRHEGVDDLVGPLAQAAAGVGRREVLDGEEAVAVVAGDLIDGQHVISVGPAAPR